MNMRDLTEMTGPEAEADESYWLEAAWLREQANAACLNAACEAIRKAGEIDAGFVAQLIHTLSSAAAKSKLDDVVDALDECVVRFE